MNISLLCTQLSTYTLEERDRKFINRIKNQMSISSIVPLANLLRRLEKRKDLLNFLYWSHKKFPTHTNSHILLAQELLYTGLLQESWNILIQSPQSLSNNGLGLRILLQISVLEKRIFLTGFILKFVQSQDLEDDEIKNLKKIIREKGPKQAAEHITAVIGGPYLQNLNYLKETIYQKSEKEMIQDFKKSVSHRNANLSKNIGVSSIREPQNINRSTKLYNPDHLYRFYRSFLDTIS